MENTVLIVGAGQGGRKLLELFYNDPHCHILAIVDSKSDTQGMRLARQLGVPIADDFRPLLREKPDLIFNVTKSRAVQEALLREKEPESEVVGGRAARFFWELREERIRNAQSAENPRTAPALLVGNDPAMLRVMEMIRDVAPTPSSVLIIGETGTGKEMVAREIHRLSARPDSPFVAINCTALPFNLFESELFGHKKGAFTGALVDKIGLVEQANGGTLFLDEIGDLPLEMQVKLLRFLQSGEFRPVGSTEARKVTVRVIAATNKNLDKAIADEQFRSDLYYRLNAFTIHLPALRKRRSDIPLYAYHFLKQSMVRANKRVESISSAAMDALMSYDWPGNLRELQGVIERAVILARKHQVEREHLPFVQATDGPTHPAGGTLAEKRRHLLDAIERRLVLDYLKQAGNNVSQAARMAGMPRRSFYRLMARLGLRKNK
ncbi:MAG: sigma-54-dependent Fis family transcriptional regulator [Calditrichaeota bacterium]|nr:MAG: sigma-54-dependent Fis family transcriptional regulator [Calditrichota bacterium]